MARTLVDIPDEKIKKLDDLAYAQQVSRAALIRLAIDIFLQQAKQKKTESGFGILKNHKINSLKLQEKLRKEW